MLKWGYTLLALAASSCCLAQEVAPSKPGDAQEMAAPAESSLANSCCSIADGTAVTVEILDSLNSALVKRGDRFRLRLAEPILAEGKQVFANIEGVGEIVHAEKSRSGGKPGELLIAARYLEAGGTQISLRGLKLGGKGKDNTNAAMAASFALGPLALFVHGREIVIPAGTLAQARIAQDLQIPMESHSQPYASAAGASENATSAPDHLPVSTMPPSPLPAESIAEDAAPQSTIVESTQEPKE
jgi:hypothetical protein